MTTQTIIEQQLANISNKVNNATSDVSPVLRQHEMSITSKLGGKVGQTLAGFKALTSAVDDIIDSVEGSAPVQHKAAMSVVQLQRTGSDLDRLTKKVASSDKTIIDQVLGNSKTTGNAFRDVVISAPFPEAMAAALKQADPLATTSQVLNAVEKNVNINLPNSKEILTGVALLSIDEALDVDFVKGLSFKPIDDLRSVVGAAVGISKNLKNLSKNNIVQNTIAIDNIVNTVNKGFDPLVENVIETSLQPATNIINKIAFINNIQVDIKPEDFRAVITSTTAGNPRAAAKILKRYSDKSLSEIESELRKIDNRASAIITENIVDIPLKGRQLNAGGWKENTNDKVNFFGLANSDEEQIAIFSSMKRESTEAIIFSTGVTNGKITSYDVHRTYVAEGTGTPFHFFIDAHGRIWTGRPLDVRSRGLTKNANSIASQHIDSGIIILLEGGDNSSNTYNGPVINGLKRLLRNLFRVRPGIQVFGANDISKEFGSPYFSVSNRLKLYGFTQAIENYDPKKEPPLDQTELAARRLEGTT